MVEEEGISAESMPPIVVKTTAKPNNSGVIVEGIDNCLTRLSHCCNPVPGDKIVGYITRGRGVAIHRADCINMIHAQANSAELNRFIPVHWATDTENTFQSTLYVTATDRPNLLLDIISAISELKTHVLNVNARTSKNNLAIVEITLEIFDTEQLERTAKKIKEIDNVLSVVRRRQ